ncbi:MAG TPA: orotidine-5'-phosphate decarboxylase [Firmicutes bacterium]|nr:MAG: orotidine-5'-phosphate decarboxylase [Candidatus Omnitrophota bacterium]HDD64971.1 orotidine-5'-phosphate decarboxylase [Bacillota bacterium]
MTQLIVSLDIDDIEKVFYILDQTQDIVDFYKVGTIPFLSFGYRIIDILKERGKKVFFDLKFFDIPNTVRKSTKKIVEMGVDFFTIHLLSGKEVIKAAIEEKGKAKIIGVTLLTSIEKNDIEEIGMGEDVEGMIVRLTQLGVRYGIDGIVCSAKDLPFLRKKFPSIIMVCPGIRLGEVKDDQKRIATPSYASKNGADFIVVGRPVYESENPRQVVKSILKEVESEKGMG